jgi:hypothetical protein
MLIIPLTTALERTEQVLREHGTGNHSLLIVNIISMDILTKQEEGIAVYSWDAFDPELVSVFRIVFPQ